MTTTPLLSIGIIFKNEIRCLERCLKSLQPLRDAIPCELVMADTGATDGSREVAAKYADILFDFPWINDFAAARNAVIERAHGTWYMSIDCDEWLGENIAQLVDFVSNPYKENFSGFIIRNYKSVALDADDVYNDFPATRIFRMSTGTRYEGAIHEHFTYNPNIENTTRMLAATIVHHDGYVYEDPVRTKQKAERNMTLLKQALEKEPDSILLMLQCIESSHDPEEVLSYVRKGIEAVKNRKNMWEKFGPPVVRYGVIVAVGRKLPEADEWIELAYSLFPESMYTRIDVEYSMFGKLWFDSKYDEAIIHAKKYMEAIEDYRAGRYDYAATLVSVFNYGAPRFVREMQTFLASAYLYEKQYENARQMLNCVELNKITQKQAGDFLRTVNRLYSESELDVAEFVLRFWEAVEQPVPTKEIRDARRNEVLHIAFDLFRNDYRVEEKKNKNFTRHGYTVFLPLDGKCILGTAAAILSSNDPEVIRKKLLTVERWNELPASVVEHAVNCGVAFPLEGKTMNTEQLEELAIRLAGEDCNVKEMILKTLDANPSLTLSQLNWVCALALVSVFKFHWATDDADEIDDGQEVFRIFAGAEAQFISCCYNAEILTEETLSILPAVHRFGWYACRALAALESGDMNEYVRLLREGVKTCPNMNKMVKFLVEHTEELKPEISPELRELAEKVKTILAAYPADDPAVVALKQTPAYQQVAFLIEKDQ